MKKTLLFSVALLGALCTFAQNQGTEATPNGYKFNQISELPWLDSFATASNFTTSSRLGNGVWVNLGASADAIWAADDGLLGCSWVKDQEMYDAIMEGTQLVDLGGQVGKVFCWQGKFSNLKECLERDYPNDDWSNIPDPVDYGMPQAWAFNFWLNPNDNFTKNLGYYRLRMVVNACHHATNDDMDNGIYDFTGEDVIKAIFQMNNQGNQTSYIYTGAYVDGEPENKATQDASPEGVSVVLPVTNDYFVKRTASGGKYENEDGDYEWDASRWVVVDYYFNVAGNAEGVDEKGDRTVPTRIKVTMGNKPNTFALLIKEFSLTKFDGFLTQEIYDLNKNPFVEMTLVPGKAGENRPDAGVEGIIDDVNALVEYFNLQGMKVANPEKGIFIKKQGKKTTKVIL